MTLPLLPDAHNAANAYLRASEKGMAPIEIVVALYQGLMRNIQAAKTAYRERDLGKMCIYNEKSFNILLALQTHLDHEQGGQAAVALDRFYTAVFLNIAKILEKSDPYQEYSIIEHHISDVCGQWMSLSRKIMSVPETGRSYVQLEEV